MIVRKNMNILSIGLFIDDKQIENIAFCTKTQELKSKSICSLFWYYDLCIIIKIDSVKIPTYNFYINVQDRTLVHYWINKIWIYNKNMMKYLPFLLFLLLKAGNSHSSKQFSNQRYSMVWWQGKYCQGTWRLYCGRKRKILLFGEWKSDKSNAFPGFSCYSSDDLVNWKFENIVLRVQPEGILGPNRVGERVKVMKCPKTGEYIMLMHADDMGYKTLISV